MTPFGNPDWELIINSLTIFLAILSIYVSVKPRSNRALGIVFWDNSTETQNVSGSSELLRQVHSLNLTFQNLGRGVIYRNDIVGKIKVTLLNAPQITKIIFEGNSKYNSIDYELLNNTIEFDFFESRDFIRIRIYYLSQQRVESTITGKIIGGSELDDHTSTHGSMMHIVNRRHINNLLIMFPAVTILIFNGLSRFVMRCLQLNSDLVLAKILKFNHESVQFILVAAVVGLISIGFGLTVKNFFQPSAIMADRIKNWYLKKEYNFNQNIST